MTTPAVETAFREFVLDPAFPCLAGKGVVRAGGYALGTYGRLGSQRATRRLGNDLRRFVADTPADARGFRAYVAVFTRTPASDEEEFERQLWHQLQGLESSMGREAPWASGVSDDPEDPAFSFSFAGRALFVVGLHSASSRLARRFRWPTLVFNPHEQFEQLRAAGTYARLQSQVRERDLALQGSLNPNLADFGERSEARQYSGRETGDAWKCPFHRAK